MKRVVVTGAQGFIGRYVVASLLDAGAQVLGVGRLPRNDATFTHQIVVDGRRLPAPLPPELVNRDDGRYAYVSLDISERARCAQILGAFMPDTIVHLASGLRGDDPARLFATIVDGTIALLESLRTVSFERFVFASTGGVYGVPQRLPIDESMHGDPIEHYAAAKLAAEHASSSICREHGVRSIVARIFNVIGPGQDERHVCGRIVSQIVAARGEAGITLSLGDLSPTRDFIDVHDVAGALLLLACDARADGIYNVASGTETSIERVLQCALDAAKLRNVHVERAYHRPAEIPRHAANVERLRALGFEPRYSLERSLRDLLSYYEQTYESSPAAMSSPATQG